MRDGEGNRNWLGGTIQSLRGASWSWKLRKHRRSLRFCLILTLTVVYCVLPLEYGVELLPSSAAAQSAPSEVFGPLPVPADAATQARDRYVAGEFAAAALLFEQAAETASDPWQRAALLANAALAHQKSSAWVAATAAINQAQASASHDPAVFPGQIQVVAQVSDIAAQLRWSRGEAESAATLWETAAIAYTQIDQVLQAWQAQLNQAQALQAAGFYHRSVELLSALISTLETQPPSDLTVQAYALYGEALRLTRSPAAAVDSFQRSLALAQSLNLPDAASQAYRRLGDLGRLQRVSLGQGQAALEFYEQAAQVAVSPLSRFQAELAKLRTWIDDQDWLSALPQSVRLWETRTQLPSGRSSLYTQIELLKQLQRLREAFTAVLADDTAVPDSPWYTVVQTVFGTDLNHLRHQTIPASPRSGNETPLWFLLDKHLPPLSAMAMHLNSLRQQAQQLGDVQAEATLLSILGALYTQVDDEAAAAQVIQAGLVLAETHGISQIAYELQAQLGRVQQQRGDRTAAIAAYQASVQTLQDIRADLVAVSSEAQYSFQQSIEPIYRELAALLLTEAADTSDEALQQAREVIELLQLAELDNFFREACLTPETVLIDQIDSRAAVLYPILLPKQLSVVVSLPDGDFRAFSVPVDPATLAATVESLQAALATPLSDASQRGLALELLDPASPELNPADLPVLPLAARLYDWLIRPIEENLVASNTQTLVFVLDGSLRNIPMSVLYDGAQYLIEKYAIALTPGLRLLNPEPLPKQDLSVIVAGLSEVGESAQALQFPPLPYVRQELETIQQYFPSTLLVDKAFSVENFENQVSTIAAPIVHLATHGQFGSTLEDTFILTWDDQLEAGHFSDILRVSELSRTRPIELLVLSACETAQGDDLAVLGLAGIAMRSGARSTLASLWQVSDPATAQLMSQFYRALGEPSLTKAAAIRQAQLSLLQDRQYRHPYYWSAFVLVGNWL